MAEVILGADIPRGLFADVSSALADMGISVRQPPPASPSAGRHARGKVIVVVSPKGGWARPSSPAISPWSSHELFPGQVAAVDLDVQFGDLGSSLGLRPEHTLAHLARVEQHRRHHDQGLPHPLRAQPLRAVRGTDPEEADDVTPDHVSAVLTMLANELQLRRGRHAGRARRPHPGGDGVRLRPVAGVQPRRLEHPLAAEGGRHPRQAGGRDAPGTSCSTAPTPRSAST